MDYRRVNSGDVVELRLSGRFTFQDNGKFREMTTECMDGKAKRIVMDFGQMEFIDSAGLGMLLVARSLAQEKNVDLTLSGAKGQVERMFSISKFSTLFNVVS